MSDFPIENRARLPAEAFQRIATALAGQHSIKHAVDWLAKHDPAAGSRRSVTQDEFCHDILVDSDDGLFLAYDTT